MVEISFGKDDCILCVLLLINQFFFFFMKTMKKRIIWEILKVMFNRLIKFN